MTLGGGGTAKNAYKLAKAGLNVLHLPKTIDNDIVGTDDSFGFSTALEIATEAIDRLHSTAHSHHRIILAEIMGTVPAGWPSARASLVALTSSCCPRCPTSWTPSSRRWKTGKSRG
ncbi:6-phosphofructokinase [Cutibacterium acnes JCM 18916]|nr:6-phosphofructokinase [Cutibacterium acnes JCM 18916]